MAVMKLKQNTTKIIQHHRRRIVEVTEIFFKICSNQVFTCCTSCGVTGSYEAVRTKWMLLLAPASRTCRVRAKDFARALSHNSFPCKSTRAELHQVRNY